jgi:5-methylcytosine-specific restriction endonuclease McrA
MSNSVLLLNADAQPLSLLPLSTISWQNAIKALFADRIKVLKNHDDIFLRSPTIKVPMPSVVMLHRYHKLPSKAKFTRRNLYIRDQFSCQYCGDRFNIQELTIDHVVPRVRGGRTSWTNCVSACPKCNTRKGQSLLKPIKDPIQPSWHEINHSSKFHHVVVPDPAWQDYINWPENLLQVNTQLAQV